MKARYFLFSLFLLFSFTVSAQQRKPVAPTSTILPRPKLVVGIMVDQMRWDYLYRYYDRYQAGGFKRMLNEGFTCENTSIDYVPTVTAIGHSTVYTGSVPSIHGIAGNDWIIQATGKTMYCTGDSTVQTVGSTSAEGKMSPRNMLASTVTDELKLATNFRSKVIGIALKDRGAILPAGHKANAAYWLDDPTNGWITSTYYMNDLPAWVKNFNGQKLHEKYLAQDWNTLYPIETYLQSSKDNNAYEGKFSGTDAPVFPIPTSKFITKPGFIQSTPYGNSFTLDFAKAAIENEKLGRNTVTDFLAVSLSSTDYVGHQFGVNAIETEDTYLRLDRDLAAFFTYLDTQLGKGNYTVFLTSDHGAAHNSYFLQDNNIPSGAWPTGQILKDLNAHLKEKFKSDFIAKSFSNYQVSYNYDVLAKEKLNIDEVKTATIAFLEKQEGVGYVVDIQNVAQAPIPARVRERIINGYNRERSGVVQIILKPGWYSGYSKTGTTHGTWSPFDARIPLVFMGWGIKHGRSVQDYHMTDIAPTVAALLRIQEPSGNIGTAISEVLK